MFSKPSRYVTRRVQDTVSPEIQSALWSIIDQNLNSGKDLDYLQVFSLSMIPAGDVMYQRVRHTQEQPNRQQTYDITGIREPVSGVTVWVIDSGVYCTMLLPDEY